MSGKERADFRYYEIPQGEPVLALMGNIWVQEYGKGIPWQHFHNLYEVGYCYHGSGVMELEKEKHIFARGGEMALIPKNYLHTTTCAANTKGFWEYLYIDIEGFIREQYKDNGLMAQILIRRIQKNAFFLNRETHPFLADLILSILREMRNKKEYYREAVRGYLKTLLVEIARMSEMNEDWLRPRENSQMQVRAALEYVETSYDKTLKIQELAKMCHLSETHFRRVFEECMNMTPVEYINLVRIQEACNLMKKSNASMTEIAHKVGFTTPSTFNRNFKRMLGTSPYRWKRDVDNYEGRLLNYRISALKGW